MILVVAHLRAREGAMPELLQHVKAFASRSRAERGCLDYTYLRSPEDDDLVVIVERWTGRESLDGHLSSADMASYRARTAALVAHRSHTAYEADALTL
ncbi:MAG TPA: putative quinol monooxygenase [Candidatus Limnocylindria bacterium]|nr:putative quinol monooxygenase [Candidatus Limnocylindria bacterium]